MSINEALTIKEKFGLNDRQAKFVYWYCHPDVNGNATKSYMLAHGKTEVKNSTNASEGCKYLKNPKIMSALAYERKRRLKDHEELAQKMLGDWFAIATADHSDAIDSDAVDIENLKRIPGFKINKVNSDGTYEIGFEDKQKAREAIAKSLGMFVDVTKEVDGDYVSILEKLS